MRGLGSIPNTKALNNAGTASDLALGLQVVGLWNLGVGGLVRSTIAGANDFVPTSNAIRGMGRAGPTTQSVANTSRVGKITSNAQIEPATAVTYFCYGRGLTGSGTLFGCGKSGPTRGNGAYSSGSNMHMYINVAGTWIDLDTGVLPTSDHAWCSTYDGVTVRIYVDGIQVNSSAASGSILYAAVDFYVGDNADLNFSNSVSVPILCVARRAWTAGEVAAVSARPWSLWNAPQYFQMEATAAAASDVIPLYQTIGLGGPQSYGLRI